MEGREDEKREAKVDLRRLNELRRKEEQVKGERDVKHGAEDERGRRINKMSQKEKRQCNEAEK